MATPTTRLLADLEAEGLLPPAQAAAIAEYERTRPFSLHYELRALLYLGIVLLVGGVGVLVYQHIDSIGHGVIVSAITLAMSASFAYAVRHRPPFTWGEAPRTSIAADYLLLLGCLLFLVLEGYLQVQYQLFGARYGLVTLLPAILFFGLAYRFDHRGVLSMAITALAAWVGVSVAPLHVFNDDYIIQALSGPMLLLGLALVAAGLLSEFQNRKRHFAFTYLSLGGNAALLAAMSRLFHSHGATTPLWLLLVLALGAGLVWYARRTQSYLFLLMAVAYSYVAVTYGLVVLLDSGSHLDEWLIPMIVVYLPLTLLGIVLLFLNIKKILRLA